MTIKELRRVLFLVENQQMTVKELRAKLFSVLEQYQNLELSDDDTRNLFRAMEI